MNGNHYLYAAYIATGIIHLAYLWTVVSRYRRVSRKVKELNRQG